MSLSLVPFLPGMPSNNLLCRDCKHFKKSPEPYPNATVRGKCLKYPFVNPVDGSTYIVDADTIRTYECKGRHWEPKDESVTESL